MGQTSEHLDTPIALGELIIFILFWFVFQLFRYIHGNVSGLITLSSAREVIHSD